MLLNLQGGFMIRNNRIKAYLAEYNYCRQFATSDCVYKANVVERILYAEIEETCTIGRRIKLKDGTFGKVRKVHGFSVQLERACTDICTWFLIDELLS
jgi:hypothetical protein